MNVQMGDNKIFRIISLRYFYINPMIFQFIYYFYQFLMNNYCWNFYYSQNQANFVPPTLISFNPYFHYSNHPQLDIPHSLNLNHYYDYSKFNKTYDFLNIQPKNNHDQSTIKIQPKDLVVKNEIKQTIENNLQKMKVNIRNILPNLCRKLLSFLTCKMNKQWILRINPLMNQKQLSNFDKFLQGLRKQNKMYLGKKDLRRIWYKKPKTPIKKIYQRLIRILSYKFFTQICPNSIILSKKMKPSLKILHLKYRRNLLKILIRKKQNMKKKMI